MSSSQNIEKFLLENKSNFRLECYSSNVKSATEAAEQIGIKVEQMVKTLLVKASGIFSLFLILSPDKLDFNKVKKLVGEDASMAQPDEILGVTGYVIGTVSPFLLKRPLIIYIDPSVFEFDEVGVGSGERGVEIILPPEELKGILEAKIAQVVQLLFPKP